MQCVQGSVAVLGGGSLVHVPEALHGGDVPLDALLGEVKLRHERQRPAVVATEQHGATVVALRTTETQRLERRTTENKEKCVHCSYRSY